MHRTPWLLGAAALLWTAAILYGSLVPLHYRPMEWADAMERARNIPYLQVPLVSRADWVANGVLFFSSGLLWSAALAWRGGTARRMTTAVFVAAGLCGLAIGLEVTQIWFSSRTVSWNDIMSEMIGSCLAGLCWGCFGDSVEKWLYETSHARGEALLIRCLDVFGVCLLLFGLAPFDFVLSAEELQRKLSLGRLGWGSFPGISSLVSVAIFAPVGVRIALGGAKPYLWGAPLLYEFAQIAPYTRHAELADLVPGFIGMLGGFQLYASGVLAFYWKSRSLPKWVPAAGMGIANLIYWYPIALAPDWQEKWRGIQRVPFATHYYGTEFQTTTNLIIRCCVFGTIGAATALSCARNRAIVLLGLVIWAAWIEIGQIFIENHIPTYEDAAISGVAVWFGYMATKRLRPDFP